MARKILECHDKDGHYGYAFYCPGCGNSHCYYTEKPNEIGARWKFNGDVEKPTFRASMLVREERKGKRHVCHSFVTDGKIQFLNDCTHEYAGKTIEMEDIK